MIAPRTPLDDVFFASSHSKWEIAQAEGMVMVQLGVPIALATAALCVYADSVGRPLADVAHDVVRRRIRLPVGS